MHIVYGILLKRVQMGTTTVISAIENGAISLLTLLLKYNPHLDHPKVAFLILITYRHAVSLPTFDISARDFKVAI